MNLTFCQFLVNFKVHISYILIVIKCKEQGMSIRKIAKDLGLSRGKVERTLKLSVSKTLVF